jgi:hypothetical protein
MFKRINYININRFRCGCGRHCWLLYQTFLFFLIWKSILRMIQILNYRVFDTHNYVKYLENMLNDSTIVTTESVSLQPVDVDSQNITPEIVHAIEVTPSAPYLSQV